MSVQISWESMLLSARIARGRDVIASQNLRQSPVTPLGPQGNILKGQSSELKISVRRKSDVWQSVDGIKGKQDEGNR
jgi:hypothetical protein